MLQIHELIICHSHLPLIHRSVTIPLCIHAPHSHPELVRPTWSQISMITPQSSDVFFSSVAFSGNKEQRYMQNWHITHLEVRRAIIGGYNWYNENLIAWPWQSNVYSGRLAIRQAWTMSISGLLRFQHNTGVMKGNLREAWYPESVVLVALSDYRVSALHGDGPGFESDGSYP